MQRRNLNWLIVAVAFAIPVAFALLTNHAWEDYFITLRSSRNLLQRNGLVYNAGDRLHTFTSPLGVLIPEVVTAIREGATTYPELIARLKPDWLILRPLEMEQQGITDANMRARYRVAKVIDHARDLRAIPFLPGRGWLEFDSQFVVFQRMHDADPEAKVSLR